MAPRPTRVSSPTQLAAVARDASRSEEAAPDASELGTIGEPLPEAVDPLAELEARLRELERSLAASESRERALSFEADALRNSLASALDELARLGRTTREECEPECVALALLIAARVVGRELTTQPSLALAWTRDAMAELCSADEGSDTVTVALGPELAALADAWSTDLGPDVKVSVDFRLPGRACEVRGASTKLAVGPQTRLMAVADALGVADMLADRGPPIIQMAPSVASGSEKEGEP